MYFCFILATITAILLLQSFSYTLTCLASTLLIGAFQFLCNGIVMRHLYGFEIRSYHLETKIWQKREIVLHKVVLFLVLSN